MAKSIKKSQSHFDALWNFRYNDRNSCGPTSWQPRQLSCLILRELFCTSCHFLHIAGIADVLPTTVCLQVWTSQEQLLRGQIRNGCKGPCQHVKKSVSCEWSELEPSTSFHIFFGRGMRRNWVMPGTHAVRGYWQSAPNRTSPVPQEAWRGPALQAGLRMNSDYVEVVLKL